MPTWWNDSYAIRRKLKILPSAGVPIRADYPLYVAFDYATLINAHKIRADFADIEVVYHDAAIDQDYQLGRDVSIVGTDLVIKFNSLFQINQEDDQYYIYMTNPQLNNPPEFSVDYDSTDYMIDTSVDGLGLSFTRPTDDWVDNTSQVAGAKAAFTFNGTNARLVMAKGPDKGIFTLTVDNLPPVTIDTYAATPANTVVYTTSGLVLGKHYLRISTTGDKNPSSIDSKVTLVSFQYSEFTKVTDTGEEINPIYTPIRIIVGS